MKYWQLIISVMDDKRRRGKLKLYYPYDDVGNSEFPAPYRLGVDAIIDSILPELDTMIRGKITGARLSLRLTLPAGLKSSPLANSDVEEGAIFRYHTSGRLQYYEHRIPSFDEALFVAEPLTAASPGIATAIINWTMYLLQPEDVLPGQPGIVTKDGANLINDWIAWESFKRYSRVK